MKYPVCNSTRYRENQIEKFMECVRCGFKNDLKKADDFTIYHQNNSLNKK